MTKFLSGMLAGVFVMGVIWFGVDVWADLNQRISALEGFANALLMQMQRS
jgi:hypothetical protein